jgi:two-component system, NtrC family, response regulator AtoC
MVLSRGTVIGAGDLPASLFTHASGKDSPESGGFLTETLERLERRMILEALEASGSVQVKAAERLGLSERTLRYRMAKLGIK